MDAFKGQENDTLKELCSENNCKIVIVPHNLTSKCIDTKSIYQLVSGGSISLVEKRN